MDPSELSPAALMSSLANPLLLSRYVKLDPVGNGYDYSGYHSANHHPEGMGSPYGGHHEPPLHYSYHMPPHHYSEPQQLHQPVHGHMESSHHPFHDGLHQGYPPHQLGPPMGHENHLQGLNHYLPQPHPVHMNPYGQHVQGMDSYGAMPMTGTNHGNT